MRHCHFWPVVALCWAISGQCDERAVPEELDGKERGPYPVGSTNIAIAPEHTDVGDDVMHDALLGRLGIQSNGVLSSRCCSIPSRRGSPTHRFRTNPSFMVPRADQACLY